MYGSLIPKRYIQKFLAEGLPLGLPAIESHLPTHLLHDYFLAEIAVKMIENKRDAMDILTWTYFYRRTTQNSNYYNLHNVSHQHLSDHLSELVENTLSDLVNSKCIAIEDEMDVSPLNLGILQHLLRHCRSLYALVEGAALQDLPPSSPLQLPQDLVADQALVLEKVTNLLSACVDVVSSNAWLNALGAMDLSQMCVQAVWDRDSPFQQIPHFEPELPILKRKRIRTSYPTLDVTHEFVKGEYTSITPIVLQISLSCDVDEEEDEGDTLVVAPHFPAKKMVSWWVVVGEQSTRQLLSIKHVKLEFNEDSDGSGDETEE
ncbi:Snrnp200 protein [Lactarius pseudohatsudake]|nr:Snrnp200 protein [Lactarius pseudohatsudake]